MEGYLLSFGAWVFAPKRVSTSLYRCLSLVCMLHSSSLFVTHQSEGSGKFLQSTQSWHKPCVMHIPIQLNMPGFVSTTLQTLSESALLVAAWPAKYDNGGVRTGQQHSKPMHTQQLAAGLLMHRCRDTFLSEAGSSPGVLPAAQGDICLGHKAC